MSNKSVIFKMGMKRKEVNGVKKIVCENLNQDGEMCGKEFTNYNTTNARSHIAHRTNTRLFFFETNVFFFSQTILMLCKSLKGKIPSKIYGTGINPRKFLLNNGTNLWIIYPTGYL